MGTIGLESPAHFTPGCVEAGWRRLSPVGFQPPFGLTVFAPFPKLPPSKREREPAMAYEIAIRGGTMVDGTGAKAAAAGVDTAGRIVTVRWHGISTAGQPIGVPASGVVRDRLCAL
jgi:hypothetical protein